MRRLWLLLLSLAACLPIPASAAAGQVHVSRHTSGPPRPVGNSASSHSAANFTLTGSPGAAVLVHPGWQSSTAVQITSTGNGSGGLGTWGAVNVAIPSTLTIGQVGWLSTGYKFTLGSCWGGSPRFELWIPDSSSPSGHVKVFLYIGPPPNFVGCPLGAWTNTGNLATASGYVDDSQLPGGSTTDTWAHAQEVYGSDQVSAVYVDVDGGWNGEQVVEFDHTQVNSTLVTYDAK